jgi:hypothetical protein
VHHEQRAQFCSGQTVSNQKGVEVQSKLWSLLHDGGFDAIQGTVPGNLNLEIHCRYLRQQFPGEGTGFRVVLRDCTRFDYQAYDGPLLTNLDDILKADPELVSMTEEDGVITVNCVMGTLTTQYTSASIFLDSGIEISEGMLEAASGAYWMDWAARNRM